MKRISALILITVCTGLLYGESSKINYNSYYRSALSLGVNYTSFSSLSGFDSGTPYNIFDLSANVRYTPKSIPWLQPEIIGGMTKFDSQNSVDGLTWDSSNYFGMTGVRFIRRSSKTFEFGFGLNAGIAQGVYKNLADEAAGTIFALGQGTVYLGLSPSYNMALELAPAIRYQHSTDPEFTEMNGFLLGIGGTLSFRFGRDPDSPDAAVKSIRFKNLQIDPLFAAMQNYYRDNPLGTVTIENTDRVALKDLTVSFYQSGYMDAPTIVQQIDELKKTESVDVPLTALFNKEIFLTEGITPLNGEIMVSYLYNNRPVEQSYPASYDLYDKTSLIWDDDRKVASFITPADSALQNYSSFIRKSCKDDLIPNYNDKLQGAIQIYQALKEIGVIYQVDPQQPFATVSDSKNMVVDSISLPRTTLSKLTGDCDDLTVLYLSLLETIGIETAFITVPGHIYTAFNTGEDSRSFGKINPDRTKTIDIDGKLWIPLEITLIGKSSFMNAWNKGAEEWKSLEESPEKRQIYITGDAQQTYRPIGLTEKDLGLQYGNAEYISKAFSEEMENLSDLILAAYYQKVEARPSKQNYNRLGIALTGFNRLSKAEKAFRDAIKLDKNYLSPRVNISNLKYLNKDYSAAAGELNSVRSILEKNGKGSSNSAVVTNLNLSKVYYAMEDYSKAEDYYKLAHSISPEKTEGYAYLASIASNSEGSRAAEVKEDQIIFLDDEE
jgi:Tetratricopeptide repeat